MNNPNPNMMVNQHGNPQMMYQNQQPNVVVVQQVQDTRPGFQKLETMHSIFVKQKFELLEALSGCETENKYAIHYSNNSGTSYQGPPMFIARERSGWCARNCLEGNCRPFDIEVSHAIQGYADQPFLVLHRECKCTFLCLNRPEVEVTLVEGGQKIPLGKVIAPFKFCDLELNIYDEHDSPLYDISGSCCQLGLFCPFPCEPCQTIEFDIVDAKTKQTLTPEGSPEHHMLTKRSPGCMKAAISDADNFHCQFPPHADGKQRALFLAATLLLDYQYFEEKQNNRQQHHY